MQFAYNATRVPATHARGRVNSVQVVRVLLCTFVLGLPVWWMLGVTFLIPVVLAGTLVLLRPSAHRHFTISDAALAGIVFVFVLSAYVNGFLLSEEPLRFVAALYNATVLACGLIIIQQLRALLLESASARSSLLRAGFWGFLILSALAWGSFGFAYAIRQFDLQMPSLFGAAFGNQIPESAALITQSTTMVFTKSDWGLPGIPMPRIAIYGPYPNATAAAIAARGAMALLHLHAKRKSSHSGFRIVAMEVLIVATLTIALSRATLAGWVVGALTANLVFGTTWRRIASLCAVACVIFVALFSNVGEVESYRQYSTESRFDNYLRAGEATMRQNPILGLGIKPREEISHIALGSHSTFVSTFTKGGVVGLGLVIAYLLVFPAIRWLKLALAMLGPNSRPRDELRVLFTLQMTVWAWLVFEDLDAPATVAMLIFIGFALIESLSWRTRNNGELSAAAAQQSR
jgi:hypothetical protein